MPFMQMQVRHEVGGVFHRFKKRGGQTADGQRAQSDSGKAERLQVSQTGDEIPQGKLVIGGGLDARENDLTIPRLYQAGSLLEDLLPVSGAGLPTEGGDDTIGAFSAASVLDLQICAAGGEQFAGTVHGHGLVGKLFHGGDQIPSPVLCDGIRHRKLICTSPHVKDAGDGQEVLLLVLRGASDDGNLPAGGKTAGKLAALTLAFPRDGAGVQKVIFAIFLVLGNEEAFLLQRFPDGNGFVLVDTAPEGTDTHLFHTVSLTFS